MSKQVRYATDDHSREAIYHVRPVAPLKYGSYSYYTAPEEYFYWYANAVTKAIQVSLDNKDLVVHITDMLLWTLAMYLNGRRVYHHSEAPPRPGEETE